MKKACLMQLPLQNALLFPCPTPKCEAKAAYSPTKCLGHFVKADE